MTEGPLTKPAHLRPADETARSWLARRPAALACAVLGVLAFVISAVSTGTLWASPDARITLPAFGVTAAAALVSIARREPRAYPLWLIGVGLAGAAIVLGYFLAVAIVVAATAILMLILHALM